MPRILLTEDDPDQRALYHDALSDAGFEVSEACSGTEAIESFQRSRPDLIVMDIQMPGMDGISALSRVLNKDKSIPVILHSAFPAYKANFLTWAADAFVVKTGEPEDLIRSVRQVLKEHGVQTPSES